jgi:hypothetical protein
MLVYFMVIWNILPSFYLFYGHFGNVVVIWYIFLRFVVLCQEKSGNPALKYLNIFDRVTLDSIKFTNTVFVRTHF